MESLKFQGSIKTRRAVDSSTWCYHWWVFQPWCTCRVKNKTSAQEPQFPRTTRVMKTIRSDSLALPKIFSSTLQLATVMMVIWRCLTVSSLKPWFPTTTMCQKSIKTTLQSIKIVLRRFSTLQMLTRMVKSHLQSSSSLYWWCKLLIAQSKLSSRKRVDRWTWKNSLSGWQDRERKTISVRN